jgi:hypothetical protein
MSKRKRTPSNIEKKVLLQSARRCCICYGLHSDFAVKKGQIAHLDQDPANSNFDNLAWLCFEHHDEYDSSTRQSKGLTIAEVKDYRDQLYNAVFEMRNPPNDDTEDSHLFIITYDYSPSSARIRTKDQFILLSARVGGIENYMIELTREILADLDKYNSQLPTSRLLFDTQNYQQLMLRGIFFDNKHGAAALCIDFLHDRNVTPNMTTADIQRAFYDGCGWYGGQSITVSTEIITVDAGSDSFFPISDEFYRKIPFRMF